VYDNQSHEDDKIHSINIGKAKQEEKAKVKMLKFTDIQTFRKSHVRATNSTLHPSHWLLMSYGMIEMQVKPEVLVTNALSGNQ